MGEEPLAETRLAISAKRTEMERDADALRDALNLKKRFAENPALFVALGAGAVFLVAGGPVRVAKLFRRRAMPTTPEKAYDSLPKPMQAWVDQMAGAVGPRAAEARQALAEELARWRHDPAKQGKVSKKLAAEMAKGPAGPKRTAWTAFEAGAAILTAALARKVVERFLSGEPPTGVGALDAVGTVGGAAQPDPEKAKKDVANSPAERRKAAVADASEDYSGMSSRSR
ncbi:MAG: hypothetical protein ABI841_06490 [Chloroflexota bacterium]